MQSTSITETILPLSETPPRTARVLPVLLAPHRALRLCAKSFSAENAGVIRELIDDMTATVLHHQAFGLAAPQVGVSLRVIVVRGKLTDAPMVLLNPRISNAVGAATATEGCLSLPTKPTKVRRAVRINVDAFDRDGTPVAFIATDMLARVIQHEVDHLDGVLMTSRRS